MNLWLNKVPRTLLSYYFTSFIIGWCRKQIFSPSCHARRRSPLSTAVHGPLGALSAQSSYSTAFLPPRRVSPTPPLGLVVGESAWPHCPAPGRRAARRRHGSGDRRVPSHGPSCCACVCTRTCRWLGANAARASESAGFGRLRRPHPPSPPSTPSATPPRRPEPLIEFAITSSLFRAKAQSKWSPGALFRPTPAVSPLLTVARRRQPPPAPTPISPKQQEPSNPDLTDQIRSTNSIYRSTLRFLQKSSRVLLKSTRSPYQLKNN